MKEETELVSVIVVNWNGEEHLEDCFNSLLKQTYPKLELILVDNDSEDGSLEYMRSHYPMVGIIQNRENLGFGAAVNRGLERAQGFFILFLNNDLYLDENCVTELIKAAQDEEVGGVVPKILLFQEPGRINSFGVAMNYLGMAWPKYFEREDGRYLEREECSCGGIFLSRRTLLEELGGFDEALFLYHEDSDLSWRIRLLGKKLVVHPQAVLYHKYHFARNPNKFYYSEKNRVCMLFKNYSLKALILILPALLFLEIAELAFSLRAGWFRKKVLSYKEIGLSLPAILKKRRVVQKTRKVKDAQIVSLFLGGLQVVGLKNRLLDWALSPLLAFYWKLIKWII